VVTSAHDAVIRAVSSQVGRVIATHGSRHESEALAAVMNDVDGGQRDAPVRGRWATMAR
jgi:hypothetical protein